MLLVSRSYCKFEQKSPFKVGCLGLRDFGLEMPVSWETPLQDYQSQEFENKSFYDGSF